MELSSLGQPLLGSALCQKPEDKFNSSGIGCNNNFINGGITWGNKLPNSIDYILLMQLAHTLLFMYLFILAHSNFLGVYFVLLVFLRIETFLLPLQTPGVVQCTEFMDGTSELMQDVNQGLECLTCQSGFSPMLPSSLLNISPKRHP